MVGQPISPAITVAVVDAKGNTITANNTQLVTLSIASGPAGAQLLGTTTVRAVNGVADFTNLRLSLAGTYTLTATGGALTPDFSNEFTIAPANVTSAVTIRRGSMHKVGRASRRAQWRRAGGSDDHDQKRQPPAARRPACAPGRWPAERGDSGQRHRDLRGRLIPRCSRRRSAASAGQERNGYP